MSKRMTKSEDIFNIQWPSNPTISPNGEHAVYERTVARSYEDDYETHLYLLILRENQEKF